MSYSHFLVSVSEKIAQVSINRPQKANALHMPAWEELKAIADELSERKDVRVIVLSGEGKLFCAGIDLELLMSVKQFEKNANNFIDCSQEKVSSNNSPSGDGGK